MAGLLAGPIATPSCPSWLPSPPSTETSPVKVFSPVATKTILPPAPPPPILEANIYVLPPFAETNPEPEIVCASTQILPPAPPPPELRLSVPSKPSSPLEDIVPLTTTEPKASIFIAPPPLPPAPPLPLSLPDPPRVSGEY